jgi:hypothetical protein
MPTIYALTASNSFQMSLGNEASESFARAHIIPHNSADSFFCHPILGFTNQVFYARRNSEQTQLNPDIGHETLQQFSARAHWLRECTSGNLSAPS